MARGRRPRDIISEQGLLDLLLVVTTLPTQAATHVAYADVAARRAAITNVFDAAHEAQLAAEAPPSDGGFTHKASLSAPRSLIRHARIDFLSEGLVSAGNWPTARRVPAET